MQESPGALELFYILIWVIAKQECPEEFIESHWVVHLNFVHFIACKLNQLKRDTMPTKLLRC